MCRHHLLPSAKNGGRFISCNLSGYFELFALKLRLTYYEDGQFLSQRKFEIKLEIMENHIMNRVNVTGRRAFNLLMALSILGGGMLFQDAKADPQGYGVNGRQCRQQKRIANGIQSGSLTGKEAYRLSKQQVRLNRRERQMRADGGGLSWAERARLEKQQNQLSKNIHEQKHDEQTR